jgi:phage gp16-like protein
MLARVMRSSKYALDPLSRLRDRQVDLTVDELARAARAREGAERTHTAANLAQAEPREAAADLRAPEHHALARGELRAADLATGEAWGLRVQGEDRVLQGRTDAARANEAQAQACEREARARLAARKVDAELVHKHRARFDEMHRKGAEARHEEASFEPWRPRR